MSQEHEVCIPGREAVALNVVRELIERNFEKPRDTSEFLQLYCRCLLMICDPERGLMPGTVAVRDSRAPAPATAPPAEPAKPRGDF
jgi:hypothetical protein